MKKVIIINGYAESGKDTFVKFVNQFVSVRNYSSVDEIKKLLIQVGWNGNKDDKSRSLICEMKKLLTAYNDYPFECLKREYEIFQKDSTNVLLFFHIREPQEIQRAVKEFQAKTLLVTRKVKREYENSSDREVDNYNYDYVVENNGSEAELIEKVELFLNSIGIVRKD